MKCRYAGFKYRVKELKLGESGWRWRGLASAGYRKGGVKAMLKRELWYSHLQACSFLIQRREPSVCIADHVN